VRRSWPAWPHAPAPAPPARRPRSRRRRNGHRRPACRSSCAPATGWSCRRRRKTRKCGCTARCLGAVRRRWCSVLHRSGSWKCRRFSRLYACLPFFHPGNSWRLAVVLRADVQGLDGAAFGAELRSRRHAIEGCLRPVVDVVVDEEQIAPGAGGDIASRAVDGVAVEQHHAAGRPCGLLYTVALDQPGQAVLVRYAELLTAQGLLIVV